ncbi:glycine betaine ABC transporter substrate-binding protein [Mesorhizobium sp. 113-3-9]|uniref:ABC transporter substrate-binding protein n=1 Tax=Mesorhizobium sp. 113-3-9 TaxID=2744517 RepID=UPI0019258FDC|nr:glycine betaine ABC transporter substrate-binding protein [Mesorhizobium sp. 113-3-9]BCG86701.1 glycine betaine ABC transporter substrate-binding protein [Mesorhizobium sp. 113-3-9]
MFRKLMTSGVAALAILALAGGAAEAKTKVVIGELDWLGSRAIEQVLNQVMTEYLDADVSTIAASQEALYESMNKGDGSVDVVADVWSDHLPAQMKNYVIPGSAETIIFNKTPYEGTEGIFIPKYVADEYGVKSLADLAKPEIAKLFDSDGNGLGELWAGAAGWESTNQTQVRAKSYGFDKTMELTTLDQAVELALLKDAYASKKPIAFYYWTPEWIFAAYELVKLEEPAFTGYTTEGAKGTERYNANGCYTFYQPGERNDWLEASDIKCSQPPTRVYVAHSKELAGRDPKIAQFLTQVKLSTDDVSKWILAMEVDGKPVEQVAKEWIDANKPKIENEWLAGVR